MIHKCAYSDDTHIDCIWVKFVLLFILLELFELENRLNKSNYIEFITIKKNNNFYGYYEGANCIAYDTVLFVCFSLVHSLPEQEIHIEVFLYNLFNNRSTHHSEVVLRV